jgi:ABC-type lipoprotein release transport system permease subunit
MRLGLSGTALGLLGAAALGRLLRGLLFGVSAADSLTVVVVFVTMTTVVMVATYVPAARASRIDPMRALRHEGE